MPLVCQIPLKAFLFLVAWPIVRSSAQSCPLCHDGLQPSTGTDLENHAVAFTTAQGESVTCNLLAASMEDLEGRECSGNQELSVIYCNCPERPTDIDCNLCEDGSLPENPDAAVFSFETENNMDFCRSFIVGAAVSSGLACQQIQDVGYSNCGCPITAQFATDCEMCDGDGNDQLPEPEREIIPFITCGGIARFMGTLGGSQCTAYQQVFQPFCGCPGADISTEQGVCRLCGEGNFPMTNPAGSVDLSLLGLDKCPVCLL